MHTSNIPSSASQVRTFSQIQSIQEDSFQVTQIIPSANSVDQSEDEQSKFIHSIPLLTPIIKRSAQLQNADTAISESEQKWAVKNLYKVACFSRLQKKELQNKTEECAELEELNNDLEEACEKEVQNYDKLKEISDSANIEKDEIIKKKDKNIYDLKNENVQLQSNIKNKKIQRPHSAFAKTETDASFPDSELNDSCRLVDTLSDKNKYVRFDAVFALIKENTQSEDVIEVLLFALKDECQLVRDAASSGLMRRGIKLSDAAIESLLFYLEHTDMQIRFAAARILSGHITLPSIGIQILIDVLQNEENMQTRFLACQDVCRQKILTKYAIAALIFALKDTCKEIRSIARSGLMRENIKLSHRAIDTLRAYLDHKDKELRFSAAMILNFYTVLPHPYYQILLDTLQDKDKKMRFQSARALSSHISLYDTGTPILIDALQEEKVTTRMLAACALRSHSTLSNEAIEALILALQDSNQAVRDIVVSILIDQKYKQYKIIPSLLRAFQRIYKYTEMSDEATQVLNYFLPSAE